MLLDIVKKGSTDRSVLLRVIDSTDGTPETTVAYNTAGIDLWYRREGGAKTSITEVTLAALTTAHADGGFLHVGDGYCRLDVPDAAFATGANYVDFGGTVTGMIVIGGRVRLVDFDNEVANTPANVMQWNGTNVAAPDTAGYPKTTIKSGTGVGELSLSSGSVAIRTGLKTNVGFTLPFVMKDTSGAPLTGSTVSVYRAIDTATSFTLAGVATEKANGGYHFTLANADVNGTSVLLRMVGVGGSGTPVDNMMTLIMEP